VIYPTVVVYGSPVNHPMRLFMLELMLSQTLVKQKSCATLKVWNQIRSVSNGQNLCPWKLTTGQLSNLSFQDSHTLSISTSTH